MNLKWGGHGKLSKNCVRAILGTFRIFGDLLGLETGTGESWLGHIRPSLCDLNIIIIKIVSRFLHKKHGISDKITTFTIFKPENHNVSHFQGFIFFSFFFAFWLKEQNAPAGVDLSRQKKRIFQTPRAPASRQV